MQTLNIESIELDGVDTKDHPDYVDAYVCYAEHLNGDKFTELELDRLNNNHPEIAQGLAFESLR